MCYSFNILPPFYLFAAIFFSEESDFMFYLNIEQFFVNINAYIF